MTGPIRRVDACFAVPACGPLKSSPMPVAREMSEVARTDDPRPEGLAIDLNKHLAAIPEATGVPSGLGFKSVARVAGVSVDALLADPDAALRSLYKQGGAQAVAALLRELETEIAISRRRLSPPGGLLAPAVSESEQAKLRSHIAYLSFIQEAVVGAEANLQEAIDQHVRDFEARAVEEVGQFVQVTSLRIQVDRKRYGVVIQTRDGFFKHSEHSMQSTNAARDLGREAGKLLLLSEKVEQLNRLRLSMDHVERRSPQGRELLRRLELAQSAFQSALHEASERHPVVVAVTQSDATENLRVLMGSPSSEAALLLDETYLAIEAAGRRLLEEVERDPKKVWSMTPVIEGILQSGPKYAPGTLAGQAAREAIADHQPKLVDQLGEVAVYFGLGLVGAMSGGALALASGLIATALSTRDVLEEFERYRLEVDANVASLIDDHEFLDGEPSSGLLALALVGVLFDGAAVVQALRTLSRTAQALMELPDEVLQAVLKQPRAQSKMTLKRLSTFEPAQVAALTKEFGPDTVVWLAESLTADAIDRLLARLAPLPGEGLELLRQHESARVAARWLTDLGPERTMAMLRSPAADGLKTLYEAHPGLVLHHVGHKAELAARADSALFSKLAQLNEAEAETVLIALQGLDSEVTKMLSTRSVRELRNLLSMATAKSQGRPEAANAFLAAMPMVQRGQYGKITGKLTGALKQQPATQKARRMPRALPQELHRNFGPELSELLKKPGVTNEMKADLRRLFLDISATGQFENAGLRAWIKSANSHSENVEKIGDLMVELRAALRIVQGGKVKNGTKVWVSAAAGKKYDLGAGYVADIPKNGNNPVFMAEADVLYVSREADLTVVEVKWSLTALARKLKNEPAYLGGFKRWSNSSGGTHKVVVETATNWRSLGRSSIRAMFGADPELRLQIGSVEMTSRNWESFFSWAKGRPNESGSLSELVEKWRRHNV